MNYIQKVLAVNERLPTDRSLKIVVFIHAACESSVRLQYSLEKHQYFVIPDALWNCNIQSDARLQKKKILKHTEKMSEAASSIMVLSWQPALHMIHMQIPW